MQCAAKRAAEVRKSVAMRGITWRDDALIKITLTLWQGLVLERNGSVRIAYRGTDWSNLSDLVTDAAAAAGDAAMKAARGGVGQLVGERVREAAQDARGQVSWLVLCGAREFWG